MNILITGGAGYIGSHVAKQIIENTDHNVVIIDNLSTSSLKTIKTLNEIHQQTGKNTELTFIEADLKDFQMIEGMFKAKKFDAVIHFAASTVVPESVKNPIKPILSIFVLNMVLTDLFSLLLLQYTVNRTKFR